MLLLLFNGGTVDPAVPISAAVITAPSAAHGYIVDRPATDGAWSFVLELGDPAAGEAFTWHDITQFYAGDSYQRGADEYLGRYRAAVAQVQLQTDDDMLAPWGQDTTSLFGVDIELDAGLLMRLGMIRVVSGVVVEWNPLWTGRVETWGDASAARGQIRTHVVTVTDTIADLANVPTVIDDGGGVTFDDFLSNYANWLFGVDSYGDTDVVIPFDLNAANAINRMDQGADPFGYVWRTRRTGRAITYPAPWDTTNVDRWANPLLDSYPSGLVFSFSPDFTDIQYIADDDAQPFGIQRTALGVLNSFIVTTPSDLWVEDDPVSEARYGVRPFVTTWVGAGLEQVVIDLLNARAFSSAQALPLRTTSDHEGFWSAMAIVDHLDPVTVIHATTDDGLVVTAPGTIRNVTEDRTVRGIDDNDVRLLSWQSTVQVDITSTSAAPALLPVEDLMFLGGDSPLLGGPSSAQFSWTNPTQPDVTPTEVQLRVLGRSLIWFPKSYPGVGADGVNIGFLSAATTYTLQVRLIRRVAGVIIAFSASRQVTFTTPAAIVPTPVPDGDSTNVSPTDELPFDCVYEVELQENDGTGWTVTDTFTGSEVQPDGTLTYPVPNSTYENDKIYRFVRTEICGGDPGDPVIGTSFDPPDDWTDPCTTPPELSVPPYTDSTLLVYVPKVCQGDDIVEAVSGITGVKGDAFDGFVQMLDQPDRLALLAIADPGWSTAPGPGIIAYGECPQINGAVGSKSLGVFTAIAHKDACVLVECANMQITSGPGSGTNWIAGATVTTPSGVMSLVSSDIAVGVDGHNLLATFDATTGDFTLLVDGIQVDADTFGAPTNTSVALPIWRVGAPPESWVTDCALWSSVLAPPVPTTNLEAWYDASDTATLTLSGAEVTQWDDKSGNAHHLTRPLGQTGPSSGTRTLHGLNVLDSNAQALNNGVFASSTPYTMFVVCVQDTTPGSPFISTVSYFDGGSENGIRITNTAAEMVSTNGGASVITGSAYGNGSWRLITGEHKGAGQTMSLWQNGTLVGTATPAGDPSGTAPYVAFARSTGNRPLDGAIAEILIYKPNISGTQRAAVEAYLQAKWGPIP